MSELFNVAYLSEQSFAETTPLAGRCCRMRFRRSAKVVFPFSNCWLQGAGLDHQKGELHDHGSFDTLGVEHFDG